MGLTHAWNLHGGNEGMPLVVWRCNTKKRDLFDPIYVTFPFWRQSHRRVCVENVKQSYSHRICGEKWKNKIRKSVATPEFLQNCLKNRFLPKVYILNPQEFQLSVFERWWWRTCTLGCIFTWSMSLYLSHIQTPAFHLHHKSPLSPLRLSRIKFLSILCSKSWILESVRHFKS